MPLDTGSPVKTFRWDDPLDLEGRLDESERLILDAARAYARERLLPRVAHGFAEGLFEGSASLLKNSIFGVFNTTTKITGTLGKGIATLSRDREFLKERELLSREKPRHAAEGFAYGVRDFSVGVFKGFFGFFVSVHSHTTRLSIRTA